MQRRRFLTRSLQSGAALTVAPLTGIASASTASAKPSGLGVSGASYMIRGRLSRQKGALPSGVSSFTDPLNTLRHFHALGATGAQIGVRGWEADGLAENVRAESEKLGIRLEGQIGLPKRDGDVARVEAQFAAGKSAGITVFRTVMLGGRRYEDFESLDAWKAFEQRSQRSLELAIKAAEKQGVKLAVENHKDWRVDEMLAILETYESEHLGVNLDTGNNIALLEDPMSVVEALAPYAMTLHLKDMGIAEYEDGFLLAEVPLSEGFLDIPGVVATCLRHRSDIQFNLEMITRDPLEVPCLTDAYWATFPKLKGSVLAQALRLAKTHHRDDLQRVSHLDAASQIAAEEANNRQSFAWWQKHYG